MKAKFKTLAQLVFFCIASFFLCTKVSFAQNINNYTFTGAGGSYTDIAGTTPTVSGSKDEGYFNNLAIGFDFWYMGVKYTTFSASTNGWLTLGQAITNAAPANNLSTGGNRPVIAPLWDNLEIYPGVIIGLFPGSFHYQTTGTAGSRILTVQWKSMEWNSGASGTVISFQAKLHETTGKIEFIYTPGGIAVGGTSPSASIGITAGTGVYRSLDGTGASPMASSVTETTTLATKPADGQTYSFTSTVAAPTSLTFTMVGSTGVTLNWIDNATDEIAYVVYASTDAINYTYIGEVAANSTSANVIDLAPGLTYSYKIYALRETLSTALSGSQIANCSLATISQIPTGSIAAIYRLDGNANDANGSNTGTLRGAPTTTTDRFGVANKAYAFNGSSQYVSTTTSYTNPNNLTISIWFKTTTTNGGKLIGFGGSQTGQSTNYDRHIYMDNSGHIVFGVNPTPIKVLVTADTYRDGNWHQAVATLSSTAGTALYIDGVLKATDHTVLNGENFTGYWRLGYDNLTAWLPLPTSFYFNGSLDDAIIYHRVLNSTEIATLYKSPDGAGNNGPVCVGATLTLSATSLAGAAYAWTGPNGFSSTLQNPTLPYSTAAAGVYAVTASLNGCTNTAHTIVTTTGVGQWTGNTNTGWAVAANWCSGTVPVTSTNAVIPGSLTNYPTVSTTQPVNNLTIAAGASVTVTGTLQIEGAITNSGTLTVSAGGIEMNGTSAQQIPANVFASNLIKNLTINNSAGVALNGALRLTGSLTNTSGTFTTDGFLTLASAASETANVTAIPSGASITGSVTVERFVSGGSLVPYRTNRMFSSPVYDNTTTFINTNVAGNRTYKFSQFIDDIIITGTGGAANGFDPNTGNTTTAYTYNSNYIAITDITNTLAIGKGAYIFFRGNRNDIPGKITTPFVNPENVILTFKGILNQQDVTVPLTYGTASNGGVGFNLVGNPYAATIDWDSPNWIAADKVKIDNSAWIWNPSGRTYATYKSGIGTNGGSRYIGSGQSFFVQANAASGSITFKESIKAGAAHQPGTLLMSVSGKGEVLGTSSGEQTVNNSPFDLLRIKLKKIDVFNQDEIAIAFKENSNAIFDNEDAIHLAGEVVSLSSLSSDFVSLAINIMPKVSLVNYIDLSVNATTSGDYTLNFTLDEFPSNYTLKLSDALLNTITTVTPDMIYAFSIDKTVASSFGTSRFRLLIEPSTVLPIELTSFTAVKAVNGVKVKWRTSSEINNDYFMVERKGDNETYSKITSVLAKGVGNYEILDKSPVIGNNYYLLKQVDKNGKIAVFGPVNIKYDLSNISSSSVDLYPNPVVDDFAIKYNGATANVEHTIKISNAAGSKVDTFKATKDELNNGYVINAVKYATGIYLVEIYETSSGKKLGALKMIKQ